MRSVPMNLALALGLSACASHTAPPRPSVAPAPVETPSAPPTADPPAHTGAQQPTADAFRTEVRPVLERRCTPCHEPGGVMYERLPFDRPETIRGHREGVLRRLKGEDRAAVLAWLDAPPS